MHPDIVDDWADVAIPAARLAHIPDGDVGVLLERRAAGRNLTYPDPFMPAQTIPRHREDPTCGGGQLNSIVSPVEGLATPGRSR